MVGGSRLVIFYLKSSVFRARVGKSLARCLHVFSVQKILLQKLYLRFCLAQIVHSKNGKILLPWQKTCLSKFLQCTAHILLFLSFSKESCVFQHAFPSRLLGPCFLVSKNVTFRLCLLHEDGIVEACNPGSIWQKDIIFDVMCKKRAGVFYRV